jgi:hypothetical protein
MAAPLRPSWEPYARSVDDPTAGEPWDEAVAAADGLLGRGAPSLAARLDAWLADARVESSADARAREHWLRAAADADATFSGVLLDLAERGVALAVATVAGRRHRGVVQVIGADFIALRVGSGSEVLLAVAAIASVRTSDATGMSAGERVVTTDLRLGDVLGELATDRARVRLFVLDGSDAVSGELRSVGQDVVTIRTDGEARGLAYVRTAAVVEVALG